MRQDGRTAAAKRRSDQKFAEPVALSSTQPADRPLPRRAFRLSLDLIALRARREEEPNGSGGLIQVGTRWDIHARTLPFSCHKAHRVYSLTTQPPILRGFPKADEGTRTLDLLHGKRIAAMVGRASEPHG